MNAEPETLWAELEARAQRLLEHAKEIEPRQVVRWYGSLLRLWHTTAYGACRTWTILTPGRKSPPNAPPLVREVTWDRPADHQRIFNSENETAGRGNPLPTLRLREASLPAQELQRLLDLGASLSVPVLVLSQTVGLDGEYFGLETYTVSPSVRAQWWCQGPVEWRHFIDWTGGLRVLACSPGSVGMNRDVPSSAKVCPGPHCPAA